MIKIDFVRESIIVYLVCSDKNYKKVAIKSNLYKILQTDLQVINDFVFV